MNNMNLNIDAQTLEQCLKAVKQIGHTDYMNICTGAINSVPWGTADWVGSVVISGFFLVLFLAVLVMLYDVIFN